MARGLLLVTPGASDCITLYPGSRRAYDEEFGRHPSTFCYAADQVEHSTDRSMIAMGGNTGAAVRHSYDEHVAIYGKRTSSSYWQGTTVMAARLGASEHRGRPT